MGIKKIMVQLFIDEEILYHPSHRPHQTVCEILLGPF